MQTAPLIGRRYVYRGRDQRGRQLADAKNREVEKVVEYANRQVANRPEEIQKLTFAVIAAKLKCDVDLVRHALGRGDYNAILVRVTPEGRKALEPYRAKVE